MPAEEFDLRAVREQHLRDQQTELAIAQDGDTLSASELHLVEDFAGGGQRLDEDGLFGGDRWRHGVQIANRQREKFPKCSGMFHDAEDGARGAVAAESAAAPIAMAAGEID